MELPTATLVSESHSDASRQMPGNVVVAGHHLQIFVECPELRESMVRDIQSATSRIWLEVYIFLSDQAGRAIAQALQERAAAGLDVRVLYDAWGSSSASSQMFAQLRAAGVQVHAFHSFGDVLTSRSPFKMLNRRNHRKLLVIDDQIAYFGGMNIVDTEAARDAGENPRPPSSAGWRDVHIRMAGPQQADLAQSFDRSWCRAHGEKLPCRSKSYRRAVLATAHESIHFFDSGPGLRFSRAARVFTRLIRSARSNITISMAYFIPTGMVLRALLQARRRGVRIRVIVPGNSDVKLVQYATAHLYAKLVKRGFGIYERDRRMLHSKVMTIDSQWTLVGSCNMDPRSLWINLELVAVIRSAAFASAINAICTYERRRSVRVTPASIRRYSAWNRFKQRMAWALRWWL